MLLFQDFEAVLGKDYDRGLELLKQFAEAKSGAKPEYIIQEIEFPATRYLGKRSIVAMADMGTHFQQVMPEVGAAFADTKTAMTDDPAGLYYTWDEANQQSDLAIVIPAAPGTTIDGLTAIDIPASKALMIVYTGHTMVPYLHTKPWMPTSKPIIWKWATLSSKNT
ncbi:MAG: hypothetical protein R2795_03680 [Saprospiraceae bacterium]